MCKLLLVFFLLCFSNGLTKAQTHKRALLKDSVDVMKLAKKHSKKFNYKADASFRVSYNKLNEKWIYKSTTLSYSRKGICKDLNGCRIIRDVTVLVNANNGKYSVQKDSTQTLPNYE